MKNFFEAKSLEANERFLNATGDQFYAEGGKQFYADGNAKKALSQPIIIIAENTSTANSTAVELFNVEDVVAGEGTYDVTGGGSVIKTSGVPNVNLRKIYAGMLAGNVYMFNKLRIECLEALTDAIKESSCGASISYQIKTAQGDIVARPIYPLISVVQQVKGVRDIELGDLIFNVDTSFTIESIPANTKMKYMFYAVEQGSASGNLLRGESGKQMEAPQLNTIDM